MNVHFEGTLKRGYDADSIFTLCETAAGKSARSAKWEVTQTEDTVNVDFGDGTRLTFLFSGKQFDGFCPTEYSAGEPLPKKSPDYAKMRLLYSLKKACREYTVTDDGTAWNKYLEAMKYKAYFRPLTEEETALVRGYFEGGKVTPLNLLPSVLYRTLKLSSMDEYRALGQTESLFAGYDSPATRWEQWINRTCLFKKERPKPVWEQSGGLDPLSLATVGFTSCLNEMTKLCTAPETQFSSRTVFGVPHGILRRMLYDDFVPAYQAAADDFERCVLVYRTFVSALEYTGFTYVGLADEEQKV